MDRRRVFRKRKEKRSQTKDDVLYGVFASGDSDDSDDGSSSRKRRKDSNKTDFTKPVRFVSKGSGIPGQEIDPKSKQENEGRPTGLGFGVPASIGINSDDPVDKGENIDFLPTAFGKKILQGAQL